MAGRASRCGQRETGTPADAADGAGSDLSKATAVGSRVRTQDLFVSAAQPQDRSARPRSSAGDITYIRLRQGFVYLVAIMDWFSRYVLAWEVSISLESAFCVAALDWALTTTRPEIFNTHQGAQFTSGFSPTVSEADITISMDGCGRAIDNIFIERLWRTVKYEEVYLKDCVNVLEAVSNLKSYFAFYNHERPHQSLGYQTPAAIYFGKVQRP